MSAERELSGYAFTEYGGDAKVYNGIHDLETKLIECRADLADRDAQIAVYREAMGNMLRCTSVIVQW